MDRLHAMRMFVRAIDEGSFAAAARALHVSPAVVTRLIAELEDQLLAADCETPIGFSPRRPRAASAG